MTKKKTVWQWGDAQQKAFDFLKKALTSAPVMAYPQTDKPWILYTDASDGALGCVLCQQGDNRIERPIQYSGNLLYRILPRH